MDGSYAALVAMVGCFVGPAFACTGPSAPPEAAVDYTQRSGFWSASSAMSTAGTTSPGGMSPVSQTNPAINSPGVVSTGGVAAPPAGMLPGAVAGMPASMVPGRGAAAGMSAETPAIVAGRAAAPMAGGASPAPAGAAAPPVAKATKLTLDYTTATYGGKYAPINIGAVWVADASGKWVYTLEMWCGWQNTKHLRPYTMAGGPDYSTGLLPGSFTSGKAPPPDVIASATLKTHKAHKSVVWNLKNASGAEVPDGMYTLNFELTEQEDAGKSLQIPFMKGGALGPLMAATSPVYMDVKAVLQ
jgi:hypothetical protein